MKKMKLLLSLFVVFFLAGCGGGGGGSSPLDVTDMAGTYSFTKATVVSSGATATVVPPNISGALTVTATNRYNFDVYIGADRFVDSGAVSVSDPSITFVSTDGSSITGTISSNGKIITFSDGGVTLEFTRV